jgi:hypothetical protein
MLIDTDTNVVVDFGVGFMIRVKFLKCFFHGFIGECGGPLFSGAGRPPGLVLTEFFDFPAGQSINDHKSLNFFLVFAIYFQNEVITFI